MKNSKGQFTAATAQENAPSATVEIGKEQTPVAPALDSQVSQPQTNVAEAKTEPTTATVVAETVTAESPQVATLTNPIANAILQFRKNDGEEVEVDLIESKLGKLYSRKDLLDSLRDLQGANAGRLVVGRKGAKSRFVWGVMAKSKIASIKPAKVKTGVKRSYVKRNVAKVEQPLSTGQSGLALKIRLGGFEQVFPLSFELATVAA